MTQRRGLPIRQWVCCFSLLCCGSAYAEQQATPENPVGVMEQPRPDYDAQGIALGDWKLFPALLATANYDDNVFRLPDTEKSDWFFETTPIVRLQRKWDTTQLAFSANADNFTYTRLKHLGLTDWTVGGSAQTAILPDLAASASAYYGEYHEGFESADTLRFQQSPTRYFRTHADTIINYQPGDWAITGGATFDDFSWSPTTLIDGTRISNGDRDETLFAPYLRLSYNFTQGYQVFARASYDQRDFALTFDRFGNRRSSNGYHLDGGLAIAIDTTWRGEAFIGYLRQDFPNNPAAPLQDVSALDYGADVTWYASPELTVHFTASRSLSDIVLPGVSVSDDQSARLGADWQVTSNVIVQGSVGYTNSQLVGVPRTDQYLSTTLVVRYLINRNVSAQAGYYYNVRNSDEPLIRYRDDTFSVGLNLHI